MIEDDEDQVVAAPVTKEFVNPQGVYIGGFCGAEPPEGSIEVPSTPEHGDQLWDLVNNVWLPLPADVSRAAMTPVSARQLRLTLLSLGITETNMDQLLINDPAGMIEWKYASYYKRTHPLVDGLGAILSITPEQIDSLWAWATEL